MSSELNLALAMFVVDLSDKTPIDNFLLQQWYVWLLGNGQVGPPDMGLRVAQLASVCRV